MGRLELNQRRCRHTAERIWHPCSRENDLCHQFANPFLVEGFCEIEFGAFADSRPLPLASALAPPLWLCAILLGHCGAYFSSVTYLQYPLTGWCERAYFCQSICFLITCKCGSLMSRDMGYSEICPGLL